MLHIDFDPGDPAATHGERSEARLQGPCPIVSTKIASDQPSTPRDMAPTRQISVKGRLGHVTR